jgi:hypothetical protein
MDGLGDDFAFPDHEGICAIADFPCRYCIVTSFSLTEYLDNVLSLMKAAGPRGNGSFLHFP